MTEVDLALIDDQIAMLLTKKDSIASTHVWKRIEELSQMRIELERDLSQKIKTNGYLSEELVAKCIDQIRSSFQGNYNRKSANIALRKIFDKVVIDIRANMLSFFWKNGAVEQVVFSVPSTRERQQANAGRASRTAAGKFSAAR